MKSTEENISKILSIADIKINGNRPWDLQIHNKKVYARVLNGGTLALGESYMDGWWDCNAIDQFTDKIVRAKLDKNVLSPSFIFDVVIARLFNRQKKSRAFEVGQRHYDVGNDLYKLMLDKRMVY